MATVFLSPIARVRAENKCSVGAHIYTHQHTLARTYMHCPHGYCSRHPHMVTAERNQLHQHKQRDERLRSCLEHHSLSLTVCLLILSRLLIFTQLKHSSTTFTGNNQKYDQQHVIIHICSFVFVFLKLEHVKNKIGTKSKISCHVVGKALHSAICCCHRNMAEETAVYQL